MIYLRSSEAEKKEVFTQFFVKISKNEVDNRITQNAQRLFASIEQMVSLRKCIYKVILPISLLSSAIFLYKQNVMLSLLTFFTSLIGLGVLKKEKSKEGQFKEAVASINFNDQKGVKKLLISLACHGETYEDFSSLASAPLYERLIEKKLFNELKFLLLATS